MTFLLKPLALLPLVLLLGACDAVVDKVSEQAAASVDEAEMRREFNDNCTKTAVSSAGAAGEANRALFAQVCGCAWDETAAGYADREQWKKDVVAFGLSQNNPELEAKLVGNMQACVEKVAKP